MTPKDSGRRTLSLLVPLHSDHPAQAAEKWLLALWQATRKHRWRLWRARAPIALELVASNHSVRLQVSVTRPALAELTTSLLHTLVPGIDLQPHDALADETFAKGPSVVARVQFRQPGWVELPKDSPEGISGLVAALGGLSAGQSGLFQFLLDPTWIRTDDGAQPAYWFVGRILVSGDHQGQNEQALHVLAGALGQFAGINGVHVGRHRAAGGADLRAINARQWPRRLFPPGHPATPAQVATLFHPPSDATQLGRLAGAGPRKTPSGEPRSGLRLGEGRDDLGRRVAIAVPPDSLVRHGLVLGPSGTGKSTLLQGLAIELAKSGHGFTVLDPHGSLVGLIGRSLPAERLDDSALLRFRDIDFPIGLNPLRVALGQEFAAAEGLIEVLQRVQGRDHWGPLLDLVLHHATLAAIDLGGTLADAARVIEDPWFRQRAADSVRNEQTARFLQQLGAADGLDRRLLPALQRLQRLLAAPWLRNILAQPAGGLDFGEAFSQRRILLCDLSGVGVSNAKLLGSLLLLLIRQATLNRPTEGAPQHTVLIDEASWFIGRTVSELFDQARKFNLGLVLAVQRLGQLQPEDVREAVLANAGTFLTFRVNERDEAATVAKHLAAEMIGAVDLQRLPNHEAYLRTPRDGIPGEPAWLRTKPPPPEAPDAAGRVARLIDTARRRYASPRHLVEGAIASRAQLDDEEPEIQALADKGLALSPDAA